MHDPASSTFIRTLENFADAIFAPVADAVSSFVFFELKIGSLQVPLIVLWLIAAAIFFTVSFKGLQFRSFRRAVRIVRKKEIRADARGEISHFQALSSAVSGTVGLGNIAGVGVAVTIGGPGATFWMIIAGLLGMCTKFVESTLAVKYRRVDPDGSVTGGPAQYLPVAFRRFGSRTSKILTSVFTLGIIFFGLTGIAMFQSNQTFAQIRNVTGGSEGVFGGIPMALLFGVVLAVLIGIIIAGGIKSIGKVAGWMVPLMATIYVVSGLIVIGVNYENVPAAASTIITGAFTPSGVGGGVLGTMIIGFQRAAFSNEAGVGSAPTAHAAVKTDEPIEQGIVASLEPFIDTVIVCTITALTIILAAPQSWIDARDIVAQTGRMDTDGVVLTSDAFASVMPWFPLVLTVAVILFAVSSILTWSYYGEKAWERLVGRGRRKRNVFIGIYLLAILTGCIVTMSEVLALGDAMLFICALVNIFGLYLLYPVVKRELRAYVSKRNGAPDDADEHASISSSGARSL